MREKLTTIWLIIIIAAISLTAWNGYQNSRSIKDAIHKLNVSQKASTKTRVTTVSQRCALTALILGVLVRVHDEIDAGGFQKSEAICLRQLKMVKAINAATPSA